MYLNKVLTMTEDSFSIMREHFSKQEEPPCPTQMQHVSLILISNWEQSFTSQLLERATNFAYLDKYIGDIKSSVQLHGWCFSTSFCGDAFHLILPPDMIQIIASATS